MLYTMIDSPVGRLLLGGELAGGGVAEQGEITLTTVGFSQGSSSPVRMAMEPEPDWQHEPSAFAAVQQQLEEYFAGRRRTFDLPLAPRGTEFQCAVWQQLGKIPYGETCSYGAIAQRLGKPKAVRAVGSANGRNPLPIVVPCHRVIGANGSLTGFGGGIENKKILLELERRQAALF